MAARVLEQEFEAEVEIGSLEPYPDNPRRGAGDAIADSIRHNGFYGAVVVQKSRRRILAGHHRIVEAEAQGLTTVPVLFVDVDDVGARKILLADNRTGDLATNDLEALMGQLQAIADLGDDAFGGTGYDQTDLDDLVAGLQEAASTMQQATVAVERDSSYKEFMERYQSRSVRAIMLEFGVDAFAWVQAQLTIVRERAGVPSNADALLVLLAESNGVPLPVFDETDGEKQEEA